MASVLWYAGYPDQALEKSREAIRLAQESGHPFTLAGTLGVAAIFHQIRREERAMHVQLEATLQLSTEYGFTLYVMLGTLLQNWVLAGRGHAEEGIAQMRQGLATPQTITERSLPYWFRLLAEAYGKVGQSEEGINVLAEALAIVEKNGERQEEAELYRLKGELTLQQSSVQSPASSVKASQNQSRQVCSRQSAVPNTQHLAPSTQEAEACFLKAIEIARKQQAKSLELRAVMSLSRLWQIQGKTKETRQMLAEIYNWFTEGFDTADLKDAKALLNDLM